MGSREICRLLQLGQKEGDMNLGWAIKVLARIVENQPPLHSGYFYELLPNGTLHPLFWRSRPYVDMTGIWSQIAHSNSLERNKIMCCRVTCEEFGQALMPMGWPSNHKNKLNYDRNITELFNIFKHLCSIVGSVLLLKGYDFSRVSFSVQQSMCETSSYKQRKHYRPWREILWGRMLF